MNVHTVQNNFSTLFHLSINKSVFNPALLVFLGVRVMRIHIRFTSDGGIARYTVCDESKCTNFHPVSAREIAGLFLLVSRMKCECSIYGCDYAVTCHD